MRVRVGLGRGRVGAVGLLALMACGGSGGSDDPASPWILVPPNPAYLAYLEDVEAGRPVPELMPPAYRPEDLALATGTAVAPPPPPPASVAGICSFPARYDLREQGRAGVPKEGTCGACWTYSSLASLESFLAPAESPDFSEAHMQLFWGADDAACGKGGNALMALRYLAAWRGPVRQVDFDPALGASTPSTTPVVRHVQNVYWLPPRQGPLDNCWIKLAVQAFGAVESTVNGVTFSPNPDKYSPNAYGGHSLVIIGWDDAYDRHSFYAGDPTISDDLRVPAGDGAFLVMEPSAPVNGFHYVSYYDGAIGSACASYTGEPTGGYHRTYQWDPYGPIGVMTAIPGQQNDYTWQANVFTAKEDEWLAAVSFHELSQYSMDYHLEVHVDPTAGPVRPGTPAATADVSLVAEGYYTLVLPSKVLLRAGHSFGVVLRKNDRTGGSPSSVWIEQPSAGLSQVKAGPGQSFVSLDGATWQDLTTVEVSSGSGTFAKLENTNFCIKAFTTPIVTADASLLPAGMSIAWEIVNDGSEDAWVQPEALRRVNVAGRFEDVGEPVHARQYVEDGSDAQDTFEGWVRVPAGGRVTAFSPDGVLEADVQVAWRLNRIDAISGLLVSDGLLQYVNALLDDPLVVTGSDPADGATVPVPQVPVIRLTFDEPAKAGPGVLGITVTSGSEVKNVFPTVDGSELRIVPSTPLTSKGLGGTTWHVHVPSDAALSQGLGNPLSNPLELTFTVAGVD